jgi:hypothetical protein
MGLFYYYCFIDLTWKLACARLSFWRFAAEIRASLHSFESSKVFDDKNKVRGAEVRCGLDCIEKEFSLSLIRVMLLTRASATEKIPLGCMSYSDS